MIDLTDNNYIFAKVDKLRKERKWTYYKLAKEASVSPTAIYNWKDRKSSPTLYLLDGVCSAFGISLIEFLSDGYEAVILTEEQKDLLSEWRNLTDEQKKSILHIMYTFKNK